MEKNRHILKLIALAFFTFIAWNVSAWEGMPTPLLHVEGRYLKDPQGNTVNLHGVAITPSPWFNGQGSRWNNYDVAKCLEYNNAVMDQLTDTAKGWYLSYIRLHIDPYWTNNPGQAVKGENDISQFNFSRLVTAIDEVILPMILHAKSRGLYVILRPPGVCPHKIEVGDEYQKYLLTVWGYLASLPALQQADNLMFELANEPVVIVGTDGSVGDNEQTHFDALKLYFQPIVDTIRAKGYKNVLWIPGTGYQSRYRGFANNPIEDKNMGYAVHIYPGFLNSGPDYEAFKKGWNENVKPVADFAPIALTEVDWSPQVGKRDNGKPYNMGTWGTGTTGTKENPGFGYNFKRIVDESGNVSWNILSPESLIHNGDIDGKVSFNGVWDACAAPCHKWFREYSQQKSTK